MKITENADGTYTLDPRPGIAEWQKMGDKIKAKDRKINELSSNLSLLSAENTNLKAELKASREAHHETTNQLRALKKETEPKPVDLESVIWSAIEMFGPTRRRS